VGADESRASSGGPTSASPSASWVRHSHPCRPPLPHRRRRRQRHDAPPPFPFPFPPGARVVGARDLRLLPCSIRDVGRKHDGRLLLFLAVGGVTARGDPRRRRRAPLLPPWPAASHVAPSVPSRREFGRQLPIATGCRKCGPDLRRRDRGRRVLYSGGSEHDSVGGEHGRRRGAPWAAAGSATSRQRGARRPGGGGGEHRRRGRRSGAGRMGLDKERSAFNEERDVLLVSGGPWPRRRLGPTLATV
jgi:hypothetical protein